MNRRNRVKPSNGAAYGAIQGVKMAPEGVTGGRKTRPARGAGSP
jgi:hypothetical protein